MQCFAICCIASVLWAICGYSLAFDGDGALIGTLTRRSWPISSARAGGRPLPESVFALYQMTFAVITPALIVGAFPERVAFPLVAPVLGPVADARLRAGRALDLGRRLARRARHLDFAGGIVVHTTAGISALVLAVMVGQRRGFPATLTPPHSPGMTMIGAGMLWVGWFGFNGGSALAADGGAANAILATHLSAAARRHGLDGGRVGEDPQAHLDRPRHRLRRGAGHDHAGGGLSSRRPRPSLIGAAGGARLLLRRPLS